MYSVYQGPWRVLQYLKSDLVMPAMRAFRGGGMARVILNKLNWSFGLETIYRPCDRLYRPLTDDIIPLTDQIPTALPTTCRPVRWFHYYHGQVSFWRPPRVIERHVCHAFFRRQTDRRNGRKRRKIPSGTFCWRWKILTKSSPILNLSPPPPPPPP